MTIVYLTVLNLIITIFFVYGQNSSITEECIPVNKLLKKKQSNDCCLEEGITCENGHVVNINLYISNLSGLIPPELGNLSQLYSLNLDDNKLSGPIPPELGNLNLLEDLNLSYNELSGTIPPKLGNLKLLDKLNLSNNELNGTIPPEFGNLNMLEELNLDNNELSGTIPPELGNLTELLSLNLNNNKLTGSIPPKLENLNLLEKFDLSYNNICGDVIDLPKCKIMMKGNKCPDDSYNETQKKNNNKSQKMILIIVGVIALLLILIILAYFKIFKSKTKNKINMTEEKLPLYNFIEDKYFEWKIENWNQLKDEEYSSIFDAHNHLWKLILITNSFNENNKESIDVGLSLCDYDYINDNEFIYSNFIIYFRNYNNNQVYKAVEYDDKPTFYNANTYNHGINNAILKSELYDKTNDGCSILENNKIIIGILIKFYSIS